MPVDVYILMERGGERTVEPETMGQPIAAKSRKKQLALAGLHCRIMVMKVKHPRGFKR